MKIKPFLGDDIFTGESSEELIIGLTFLVGVGLFIKESNSSSELAVKIIMTASNYVNNNILNKKSVRF